MSDTERLTALDASFIFGERPPVHTHIGSLLVFEGIDASTREIADHVDSRLHRIPRFRKRLHEIPLGLGRPVWADDEHFDIDFHVRRIGLPRPGGEAELLEMMGRLQSMPLDRSRPLWELWIIDLPDGRNAVVQKTHHSMVDGISGVDVVAALLDIEPETTTDEAPDFSPGPAPSQTSLIADSLVSHVRTPLDVLRGAVWMARNPGRLVERLGPLTEGLRRAAGGTLARMPETSLNKDIGPLRRYAVVRADLDAVKDTKKRHGTTVNDVVLAAVASGTRRLLEHRGELRSDLVLKTMVPVSMRADEERMALGNQVATLFVELPVGVEDPLERLSRIHAQTRDLKDHHEAVGTEAIMHLMDHAPTTLVALGARAAFSRQQVVNLVVTNVPGPPIPVWFMGHRMLEAFPYVPLGLDMAVGVAIVSYMGQLNLGITADHDSMDDLDVLVEGIEAGFAEL